MHIFYLLMQAAACLFIAAHSVITLNKMAKTTAFLIRASYVALATAAGSGLMSCFISYDAFECLFAVGVALYLVANERGARYAR